MNNKICGVGINDYDGCIYIGKKNIKSYNVWTNILKRCYDIRNIHYKNYGGNGVKVCDEWLSFSKFKEWFDKNYRWDLDEIGIRLELDKDLLSTDIKIYSPDTCIFIPKRVNVFMANKRKDNTSGYTGVYWYYKINKWKAQINDFNSDRRKSIGYFKNIEDARDAYIKAREVEALKVKEYLRELGYNEDIVNKIK